MVYFHSFVNDSVTGFAHGITIFAHIKNRSIYIDFPVVVSCGMEYSTTG